MEISSRFSVQIGVFVLSVVENLPLLYSFSLIPAFFGHSLTGLVLTARDDLNAVELESCKGESLGQMHRAGRISFSPMVSVNKVSNFSNVFPVLIYLDADVTDNFVF